MFFAATLVAGNHVVALFSFSSVEPRKCLTKSYRESLIDKNPISTEKAEEMPRTYFCKNATNVIIFLTMFLHVRKDQANVLSTHYDTPCTIKYSTSFLGVAGPDVLKHVKY